MVHEVLGGSGDAAVLDYIVSCLQVGGSIYVPLFALVSQFQR